MATKRRRSIKQKPSNLPTNQARWLEEEGIESSETSYVGKDVLFEILVRLPIKCLLRFKTVSKYWFRLISSREFIQFRLRYACDDPSYTHHRFLEIIRHRVVIFRQAPLLPTLGDPRSINRRENDIPQPMEFSREESFPFALKLVGSCSGLLCIASVNNRVIVWNPALRKCKRLPYFGRGSDVFYGFGYVKSSDDFKVVGIRNTPKTLVKIYSARTDSWKKLQEDDFEVGEVDGHGCFLNGKLHWATQNKSIFTIDLSTERFGVMELPECVLQRERGACSIFAVGEFLSVFCFYGDRSYEWMDDDADFYMMERYGVTETWTKVNSDLASYEDDDFLTIAGHWIHHPKYIAPMYVAPSEPGEVWWTIPLPGHMTTDAIQAFLFYNLKHGGYPFDDPQEFFFHFALALSLQQVAVYVESLIWPFLGVSR